MKKLFTIVSISTLLFSCSQDNINTEMEEEAKLNLEEQVAQGMYDNSNLGVYEGLFTTLDGKNRATILIEIDGKNNPVASFSFPDGELSSFRSQENMTKGQSGKLHFNGENFSFDFTVNEDGSNPQVTNIEYAGKKGDVLIAKETSKAAVATKTGTYTCESGCFTSDDDTVPHPELGAPGATQTFNFMIQGASNGQVDMQYTLNNKSYSGTAQQNNCKLDITGQLTTCELFADTNLNGRTGPIRFRTLSDPNKTLLTHQYFSGSGGTNCSTYAGSAVYRSTLFGRSIIAIRTDDNVENGGDCR